MHKLDPGQLGDLACEMACDVTTVFAKRNPLMLWIKKYLFFDVKDPRRLLSRAYTLKSRSSAAGTTPRLADAIPIFPSNAPQQPYILLSRYRNRARGFSSEPPRESWRLVGLS